MYTTIDSYGSEGGGFVEESSVPDEKDSTYTRHNGRDTDLKKVEKLEKLDI
jgi:hypothetical protein